MELKKFTKELIEKTKDLVDDIELCISTGKSLEYEIKNKKIIVSLSLDNSSIGIRVLKEGKLGSSAITSLDVDEGLIAVKKALTNTKPTVLKQFSKIKNPPEIGNFDQAILDLFDNPVILRDIAEEMQKRIYDKANELESFEGAVVISYNERLIATKNGLSFSKETSFNAFAEINSIDFDFVINYSKPEDFEDVKNLGVKVYDNLLKDSVTPAELDVKDKELEVVLDPRCFESILRTLLGEKVYGSAKEHGLTELEIGDLVASKILTIIDTGIKEELLSSSPTDDEGNSSKENILIENGVLNTFLYDAVSALKANKKPTGNGIRRPILAEDCAEAPIRESLRGLYVKPGNVSFKEMISNINKGIYVKTLMGLHGADKSRASFVAGIHIGKSIEQGKFVRLLAPGAWNLSGNLFDLDGKKGILKDIELTKETLNTGSAILPWLKVKFFF